jgi:guanine deaminase
MNEKSIYAHCIYLTEEEIDLIKNTGAIICHCPTSNRYLSSGIMSLNEYANLGIRISIGSDVGAGYSLSILNEAKEAIENSNIFNILYGIGFFPFCVKRAFYLATRGAAKILYPELNIGLINRDFVADISFFEIDGLDELMTAEDVIRKLFYTKFNQVAELVLINGEIVHGNIKAQRIKFSAS